jgi:fibronectin type 3 domain-containing protein
LATGDLSELPAPSQVVVSVSLHYTKALEVSWMPPAVEGVAGYRILRAETTGGPYELVGQATGIVYKDLLLETGQPYFYIVQAFDASGVRSPYSAEGAGLLPLSTVYLPLVHRESGASRSSELPSTSRQ